MSELSQKPDYEMMWKVECELNKKLQEENKTMREALESISKNSCCEPCQEAKLVAREALAKLNEKQGEG